MRDDVDHVVEAWRRERPDLDTTPLEVLSRVSRLALHLDRACFDARAIDDNPFFLPDSTAVAAWSDYLDGVRKDQNSVGAAIEVLVEGCPPGLGAPVYAKLDTDLAAAMMSINAVKGVEIGEGFAAAALSGEENADEMRPGNAGAPVFLSNRAGGGLRAVIHLPTVKHGQGGHGGSTPRATKSREGSKHVPT